MVVRAILMDQVESLDSAPHTFKTNKDTSDGKATPYVYPVTFQFFLVKARRVQFAGHCARASSEVISSLLLWKPKLMAQRSRKLTFPDTVSRDRDRESWQQRVESIVSTVVEQ